MNEFCELQNFASPLFAPTPSLLPLGLAAEFAAIEKITVEDVNLELHARAAPLSVEGRIAEDNL